MIKYLTFKKLYKIINNSKGRQNVKRQFVPRAIFSNHYITSNGKFRFETITGIILFLLLNLITYINISNWTIHGIGDIF
jgi:hypothetical protein